MSGINGLAGSYLPELASQMNKLSAHRGPDGTGVYEDPAAQIALGHVRLSVLDLSDALH
jgi:asparagine synthase (glutamine-hydrolysing)